MKQRHLRRHLTIQASEAAIHRCDACIGAKHTKRVNEKNTANKALVYANCNHARNFTLSSLDRMLDGFLPGTIFLILKKIYDVFLKILNIKKLN